MWIRTAFGIEELLRFFYRLICNDMDIVSHYRLLFQLTRQGFTLTELEAMLPYELEIYTSLLVEDFNKKKNRENK